MPERKNNKEEQLVWTVEIDNEARELYLVCPKCKSKYHFNILGTPRKCGVCGATFNTEEEYK